MIQLELEKRNIQCSMKKMMVDFEIEIQKAIILQLTVDLNTCEVLFLIFNLTHARSPATMLSALYLYSF